MDEDVLKNKIERAIEIICPLYQKDLITKAFIVGSVAKGTARKESDIDIILINPFLLNASDFPPSITVLPYYPSEEEKRTESMRLKIVETLKDIGVEFKELSLKDMRLWYQLYKNELFHFMTRSHIIIEEDIMEQRIEITPDLCK